ncbi:MAG TPA: hypothetical protein G4N94_00215, partial [Caldilineae bacterium]|nr:hypothetical protein [Caldilineae bacterium]
MKRLLLFIPAALLILAGCTLPINPPQIVTPTQEQAEREATAAPTPVSEPSEPVSATEPEPQAT